MVSVTILPNSVMVGVSGKRFPISKEDPRYDAVVELYRSKNGGEITDEEMLQVCDPTISFSEEGVRLTDGVVYINDEAMPPELSTRIVDMKKQKIPIIRLVNFWKNLQQNPSMNSVQQLYKFLEHNGHPLTEDGCFIAYRSVREDWKDFHTGTMDNSIGKTLVMPRNKVNDKPEETCSHGLHVASWEYASQFGSHQRRLIEVKVNPKDVVCVPNDYNNTKMRVCEFTVLSEVQGPTNNVAFRSTDMDEEACEGCDDDSCDMSEDTCGECDCESCECDERNYTDVEADKVRDAHAKFSDTYSDSGLVSRIAEETGIDEDIIEEIIDDEGL